MIFKLTSASILITLAEAVSWTRSRTRTEGFFDALRKHTCPRRRPRQLSWIMNQFQSPYAVSLSVKLPIGIYSHKKAQKVNRKISYGKRWCTVFVLNTDIYLTLLTYPNILQLHLTKHVLRRTSEVWYLRVVTMGRCLVQSQCWVEVASRVDGGCIPDDRVSRWYRHRRLVDYSQEHAFSYIEVKMDSFVFFAIVCKNSKLKYNRKVSVVHKWFLQLLF